MNTDSPSRHSANPPEITPVLKQARVFIAGAGGLGSNVANILARTGIGAVSIADFDLVSISNLNRQMFLNHQIGMPKTQAIKDNLLAIDPGLQINTFNVRLSNENFSQYIDSSISLVFECFDNPASKAALTRFMLSQRPECPYVAVSGIGGYSPVENIRIIRKSPCFQLVGDMCSDAFGHGTLASRVIAAAAMQAHCGIMMLMEKSRS